MSHYVALSRYGRCQYSRQKQTTFTLSLPFSFISFSVQQRNQMRWWWLNCAASLLMLILLFVAIVFGEAVAGLSTQMGRGSSLDSSRERWGYRQSNNGCFLAGGEEEELAMDSEINSRILAETTNNKDDYISYKALEKGSTPCSERGAPYSHCRPEAKEHPYNRGCSKNTGCYRWST